MRPIISSLLKEAFGYRYIRSQKTFQRAYIASLRGMNYDSPHYFENGEIAVMDYVFRQLSTIQSIKPVIFDVGANIGDYTKNLYEKFGADIRIFCFELKLLADYSLGIYCLHSFLIMILDYASPLTYSISILVYKMIVIALSIFLTYHFIKVKFISEIL